MHTHVATHFTEHYTDVNTPESPDSAAWFRGAEGRQVLAHPPCITDEASEVLDALVRAQHHIQTACARGVTVELADSWNILSRLHYPSKLDVDRTMRSYAIPTLGATHRVLGLLS